MINLIDNGIRYHLEKIGTLIVTGSKTGQGTGIEVYNTGRPVPEEDLEQVFEQFFRVEKSRAITHGGSGLGLAIAKKIVELHDGTIHITHEPGHIIKVTLFFPVTA